MALQTLANPATVADRLQTYFSKLLLQHAVHELVLGQFGMKAELPQKASSKTIRFFRREEADSSRVSALTEGVPLATYSEISLEYVDVTLGQLGEIVKLSDVLEMVDAYEPLQQNIAGMGEDAALKADDVIRNQIVADMQNLDNGQERFAGIAQTNDGSVDFASAFAAASSVTKLTRTAALSAATQLKKNKAPKINGRYIGVISPEVAHDLRGDTDWLEAAKYSNVQALYNGEVGVLDGIRYIETTNPHRENAYGTYNAAGALYSNFFLGNNAYGTPKMAGTSSPFAPKVTILDKADKSDPLNQFMMAGWKVFWAAKVLNSNWVVNVRSKSTFV